MNRYERARTPRASASSTSHALLALLALCALLTLLTLLTLNGCLGGQTGQADSVAGCYQVHTSLDSTDELGFSGEDVLAMVQGTHAIEATWDARNGVAANGTLRVERASSEARVNASGCAQVELELDVHVKLMISTDAQDSAAPVLATEFDALLRATSKESALLVSPPLTQAQLTGAPDSLVGSGQALDRYEVAVRFDLGASEGSVSAVATDSTRAAIAHWPR